MAVKPR